MHLATEIIQIVIDIWLVGGVLLHDFDIKKLRKAVSGKKTGN